jgi:hypothetical protein
MPEPQGLVDEVPGDFSQFALKIELDIYGIPRKMRWKMGASSNENNSVSTFINRIKFNVGVPLHASVDTRNGLYILVP